jgi:catalase
MIQPYLRYSPAVEQPAPDEAEIFEELGNVMFHITRTMAERYRHAYRPVHAKSHGIVKAKLEVLSELPPELAQGLFADAGTHDALLRFSTNPGDMLADNVSSPRGLTIKVFGANGDKLGPHTDKPTQDFVCVSADVFGAPDPKAFLGQLKSLDKTLELPEGLKHVVSFVARETNQALRTVNLHSGTLDNLGYPAIHPLGERFTTVAPVRYGEYVAKIAFTPSSESLTKLTDKKINLGEGYNPLRDLMRQFFADETGVWDMKVQLALTDAEHFPIEKADVRWPVEQSPWQTVARVTVAPQESYSDARQVFVDETMGFNPWNALALHQPLGGVMRSRRAAYEAMQQYRAQRNSRIHLEPSSIEEVPD